ncbi:MAG: helix-turn-helix domain-containing protein [Candidatus Dormibacteria bacterium]
MAEATGIHQSEISRIERGVGNPTEDTLARLGRALGARLAFITDSSGCTELMVPRPTR